MTSPTKTDGAFNGLIAEYMRNHNFVTVKEFAEHIGLSRSTIYDLIRSKETLPSLSTLILLARALDRPTHELLYLAAPDAPGAPDAPMISAKTAALARLKRVGQGLPDVDTFLRERREDERE